MSSAQSRNTACLKIGILTRSLDLSPNGRPVAVSTHHLYARVKGPECRHLVVQVLPLPTERMALTDLEAQQLFVRNL